jgi:glycosyltransferase involved in cell wall biosynthesis
MHLIDGPRENGSRPRGNGNGRDDAGGARRAVVTIVSNNYLSRARVLCRSLREHEPEVRRFVLIVDRPIAVRSDEPFEPIPVEALDIPDFEDFMAQYTVMEANTAVKPYVMSFLFKHYSIEELVYLDPDIMLTGPLTEVWAALERGNVVLTPHLRDPFRDEEHPNELEILRSGTYNLGFVGTRRGATSDRLFTWWAEKTEHDCVVDLANSLFVDQKWMDLVPGYLEGVEVLRDPGYNVAYWNLHERKLSESAGTYYADGAPLAFFHFSGYDPERPTILSRHQSRHTLATMPVVRKLCDLYAQRMKAEGHDDGARHPYGFANLRNGIPISKGIRAAIRMFRKQGVDWPSVTDADAFCRFVATPNVRVCGTEISPFVHHVLASRCDVEAAYPCARHDARDPDFLNWLENSGHECQGDVLYARFRTSFVRINPFDKIHGIYERRDDLRSVYPEAFRSRTSLEDFGGWLYRYGVEEEALEPDEIAEFLDAGRTGFENVVEYYLASPMLQAEFPLALLPCGDEFVDWLLRNAPTGSNLGAVQVKWFQKRVMEEDVGSLALLTALRNEWVRLRFPLGATIFGWPEFCGWLREHSAKRGNALTGLPDEPPPRVPFIQQLEILHTVGSYSHLNSKAFESREELRAFADAALALARPLRSSETERVDRAIARFSSARGVNVAGYFHYSAGVGSSVRSLTKAMDAVGVAHDDVTLPVCPSSMMAAGNDSMKIPERYWRQHRPDFGVSITVANADAMSAARAFLGPAYEHRRRHIAYWVWETDSLPGKYAAAAEGLDAIWTPSEFSANALRRTLGDRVEISVVRHAVSPKPVRSSTALPFELPERSTLIGFFFDTRSVVERKNPEALLRAFRLAFRRDDDVTLVLKVGNAAGSPASLRKLEALAEGLPVIWLRDTMLDEAQTSALLSRLDIYASLHRAEGFGLVLAEAMALGKAVVATDFSGNLEFMDDQSSRLVSCRTITTDRAYGPYPRGTEWADPDVEHAAELLRTLAHDRELRYTMGLAARHRIEQLLSPAVVGRTVLERLGWSETPPPGARRLAFTASNLS